MKRHIQVGETALAIGNPYGPSQSVTMGIVSALRHGNLGIEDYEDFKTAEFKSTVSYSPKSILLFINRDGHTIYTVVDRNA